PPATTLLATEPHAPEGALDASFADAYALAMERAEHPWAAVGPITLRVKGLQALSDGMFFLNSRARGPFGERVVALTGYTEQPTKDRHRVLRLLRVDEREPHSFSFAKKAAAFFRISRSVRSAAFSFFSRSFSRSSLASRCSTVSFGPPATSMGG